MRDRINHVFLHLLFSVLLPFLVSFAAAAGSYKSSRFYLKLAIPPKRAPSDCLKVRPYRLDRSTRSLAGTCVRTGALAREAAEPRR